MLVNTNLMSGFYSYQKGNVDFCYTLSYLFISTIFPLNILLGAMDIEMSQIYTMVWRRLNRAMSNFKEIPDFLAGR